MAFLLSIISYDTKFLFNMEKCKHSSIIFLIFLCCIYLSMATAPELIPRSIMFAPPAYSNLALSADGTWMSWISYSHNTPNIWIRKLPSGQALQLTTETDRGVFIYTWMMDNRTVVYSKDKNGDENWRLYSIDVISKYTRLLIDTMGVSTVVLKQSVNFPSKLIIGMNDRDPRYHDVYELDLATGLKKEIFRNDHYSDVVFDDNLKIRIIAEELDDKSKVYYAYDPYFSFNPFIQQTKITAYPLFKKVALNDSTRSRPLSFDKSNTKLYWLDDNDGKDDLSSLYLIDFATKNKTLIYKADRVPIESVFFHPADLRPLFLKTDLHRPGRIMLDKRVEDQIQTMIQKVSEIDPGKRKKWNDILIIDTSLDLKYWIITPDSDQQPDHYFLYNENDKSVQFLFSMNQLLDHYTFAPTKSVKIPASDNKTELCYLSVPVDSDLSGKERPWNPLPLIITAHTLSWSRQGWGFDIPVQYFANRGYATMHCNFKSSVDSGKLLLTAAGGWDDKMQTDLVYAVNWALERRIVKSDKIAIFGDGYGGYVVLSALSMFPDFYECGVDIVGPSNIATLLNTVTPLWKSEYNLKMRSIGGKNDDPERRDFPNSRSPLNLAQKIKKPLLIAHGLNDPRISVNQSLKIADSMKQANTPFTYMLFPNEGHGFLRPDNNLALYAEIEQFLAKCLGGTAEPVKNEFNDSLVAVERFDNRKSAT